MKYKICYTEKSEHESRFNVMEFNDRHEVSHWVYDNLKDLQKFAVPESGNIFGYAAELNEKEKPIALLYFHKVNQFIWIDMS